ncbi:MAG: hypothetical protein ACRED3_05395, partial [Bradyrhizobium sp.]
MPDLLPDTPLNPVPFKMLLDAIASIPRRYFAATALSAAACGTVWAQDPKPAPASGPQFLVDGKPFRIHGITYA